MVIDWILKQKKNIFYLKYSEKCTYHGEVIPKSVQWSSGYGVSILYIYDKKNIA